MESSTEPSIVPLSPSASSVCLTNPEPVMDSEKAEALAWYHQWRGLVDLHKEKLNVLKKISNFCKTQAPPDSEFAPPLRIRDSFAHKYRTRDLYNGTGRKWFTSFLQLAFETEPEFFRSDEEKKDFVLSFFTAEEVDKFKAFHKNYIRSDSEWPYLKQYLGMN